MPVPRMTKRTALDVVLGTAAAPTPEEAEQVTLSAPALAVSAVPDITPETVPVEVPSKATIDTSADEATTIEESENDQPTAGDETPAEHEARAQSYDTEHLLAGPAARPRMSKPKAASRKPPATATPPALTADARFEPVLGKIDDDSLAPFSTRLRTDLRRRLKVYSAISGESSTSLVNRAVEFMLEDAEKRAGMK